MGNLQSTLTVTLLDRVTGPAQAAASSLQRLTSAAKAASFAGANEINRASRAMTSIATGVGVYKAHESILKFQTATNKLSAANPDFKLSEIREVQKLAREVSRNSLFDPGTVMDAANSLARADVNLDAIKGTLKPLATAAMAADTSVDKLADSFVKLSSNFGMSLRTQADAAKTFTYLGDLAVYVGQKAPGTFDDYVQAMKQVGAAARTAGIDIKWLSGAYIALDKAGIRNEEAGTALRSLVKHLTQPTLEARKMYAQLGIDPSTFLKSGKQVTSGQFVAAFQSEYGKSLEKAAPKIQEVLTASLDTKGKSNALMEIVEKMWGGGMKPVDARKVKKTIDNFLFSSTERIDPQAWVDELKKKGTTLGQFLRLVEPKQASRLINLVGDENANKPLGQLDGFQPGMADDAGAKMMQGYPAAIKKMSDAFQSLIEAAEKAGAVDAAANAMNAIGSAIVAISQGTAGLKEWIIGIAAISPAIAAVTPAFAKLATVIGTLGAAVATSVAPLAAAAASIAPIVAAFAAIASWPWVLKKETSADEGKTSGERLEQQRGGSVTDARRRSFASDRERLGIDPVGSVWSNGAAPIEHLDGSSKASAAGTKTGEAFKEAMSSELAQVTSMIQSAVQQWAATLSFSATPTITPKINNPAGGQKSSGLDVVKAKHAVYADIGLYTV